MTIVVRELTSKGRGGVTVIEVVGEGARDRLIQIGGCVPVRERFALVGLAEPGGAALEEGLVLHRGQDHFEIHLTGSPPLVRRVLLLLSGHAVEEGHSVETRAWKALAKAPCEAAARVLLDQSRGALRLALTERIADPPGSWRSFIDVLVENARIAERLLRPVEVVLTGPTNAGKSTLFNVLVGRERVAVSGEPGTTRDPVQADAVLGEWPVHLIDTAGERIPPAGEVGSLERAAQARAHSRREGAALSIWLDPLDTPQSPEPVGGRLIRIASRADLGVPDASDFALSALRDPEGARRTVARAFLVAFGLPEDPWRPGAPVPFEPDLVACLPALAKVHVPGERFELLSRFLGPCSDPSGGGISGVL